VLDKKALPGLPGGVPLVGQAPQDVYLITEMDTAQGKIKVRIPQVCVNFISDQMVELIAENVATRVLQKMSERKDA